MEKLNRKDIEILLELIKNEKESIHTKAIRDAGAREKELDLDFIGIKLNTMIKILD